MKCDNHLHIHKRYESFIAVLLSSVLPVLLGVMEHSELVVSERVLRHQVAKELFSAEQIDAG